MAQFFFIWISSQMSPPCDTHLQSSSLWPHCPSLNVITYSLYQTLCSMCFWFAVWFFLLECPLQGVLGSLKNSLTKKSFPCWSCLWGTWRIHLPSSETKMRSCWFSKFLLRLEGLEKCNFKGITPLRHYWISQTLSWLPWDPRGL